MNKLVFLLGMIPLAYQAGMWTGWNARRDSRIVPRVGLALCAVAGVLMVASIVYSHDQRIQLRTTATGAVIESVTPADGPTPVPTSIPTPSPAPSATAGAKCPAGAQTIIKGVPFYFNYEQARVFCATVNEPLPPQRIRYSWYDESDQERCALAVAVQQMAGARILRIQTTPTTNGFLDFTLRSGGVNDPARVANGLYLMTVSGAPAGCRFHVAWGIP